MGVNHGGTGGDTTPEFVLGDGSDVRPPEFSTYNVLNNTVCRLSLFMLICTEYYVLHCI